MEESLSKLLSTRHLTPIRGYTLVVTEGLGRYKYLAKMKTQPYKCHSFIHPFNVNPHPVLD